MLHTYIYLVFIIYLASPIIYAQNCTTGWFGPKCQFRCRCSSCDTDGSCQGGCTRGWFGFKCQYVDLMKTTSVITTPWKLYTDYLNDGDDVMCYEYPDLQSVELKLDQVYPFTWMRIKVKNESLLTKIFVNFKHDQKTVTCQDLRMIIVDNWTMDVKCRDYFAIGSILLQGDIVKYLCSVYVSGGRNVALNGETYSSSIYKLYSVTYDPWKAVDGNTDNHFSKESCTHSNFTDTQPSWTLTLNETFSIDRFVIYNRGDCCKNRLSRFVLETKDKKGAINFNYTGPYDGILIYTVLPTKKLDINVLTIKTTAIYNREVVLTLCEVEVYGDCQKNKWGLSCDNECDRECHDICHIEDGKCETNGSFHGHPSFACSSGNWGINCSNECGSNCYQSSCDAVSGYCDKGCLGFENPPNCTQKCQSGVYGLNCTTPCPGNCRQNECNIITGECTECQEGYAGKQCYEIQSDDTNISSSSYFGIGFGVCLGVIGVIAVIIFIVSYFWRRRLTRKRKEIVHIYNRPKECTVETNDYEQCKQFDITEEKVYENI